VQRCFELFVDVQRSTQLLMDYQKDFLFNDLRDDSKATSIAAATGAASMPVDAEEAKTESMEVS
jgi:hypothetical protein